MLTTVEFRSDRFPAYEGEEEQINPGLWGMRLAEFVRDKLLAEGLKTGEPLPKTGAGESTLKTTGSISGSAAGVTRSTPMDFFASLNRTLLMCGNSLGKSTRGSVLVYFSAR